MTAALQAKTTEINSVFRAVCIVDIDSSKETGATKYADVKVQKERQAGWLRRCPRRRPEERCSASHRC